MLDRVCISLGEKCNLKCSYCHFDERLTNDNQDFTVNELKDIIESIYKYVVENKMDSFTVGIVGSGEPLLEFKKIKSLISYVREKDMNELSFYTITNGTVITKDILEFFYNNKDLISLCFSLDGPQIVHDFGREKFNKVYDGINDYENLFKSKPSINCTVHKKTIDRREEVFDFIVDNNFRNVTFSKLVDRDDSIYSITEDEYIDFLKSSKKHSFTVRQLRNDNIKKYDCTMYGKLCGVGKNNPFITKAGIFPCGRFYGNPNFNYGCYTTPLQELKKVMNTMLSLKDGECYYQKYISETK